MTSSVISGYLFLILKPVDAAVDVLLEISEPAQTDSLERADPPLGMVTSATFVSGLRENPKQIDEIRNTYFEENSKHKIRNSISIGLSKNHEFFYDLAKCQFFCHIP